MRRVDPSPEQIDALYREQVLWAREQSLEEKLLDGPRLFDLCCRLMADGIRHQFPELDEEAVERQVDERLALQRRLENGA